MKRKLTHPAVKRMIAYRKKHNISQGELHRQLRNLYGSRYYGGRLTIKKLEQGYRLFPKQEVLMQLQHLCNNQRYSLNEWINLAIWHLVRVLYRLGFIWKAECA